eukprot:4794963-Amphidinium_carterae.1
MVEASIRHGGSMLIARGECGVRLPPSMSRCCPRGLQEMGLLHSEAISTSSSHLCRAKSSSLYTDCAGRI